VNDPAKINIRDKALTAIDGFMRNDELIKIQYAAKYAGISNSWKKWQGEVLGLTRTNAVAKKKAYEAEFQKRVFGNAGWKEKYATLLSDIEAAYAELKPFGLARDYFSEIVSKIELFTIASQLNSLGVIYEKEGSKGLQARIPVVKNNLEGLFAEYNSSVDQKLFEVLMQMYVQDQEAKYVSPVFKELISRAGNNYSALAADVYNETNFDDKNAVMQLLSGSETDLIAAIKSSKLIPLYLDMLKTYQTQTQARLAEIQPRINQLQRTYMQAQMEVFKEKTFYPDANSTMRVTYGNVKSYQPADAVKYDFYSYLDGVMEKYKPGDYEFDVPEKLRTLYKNKDYGQYGSRGKMPVCFIASNHTTGGNSGSPVLDAYGNLIGLNFDRVWEGTMSDINYDPSICRNIMVDIRYVLFIVDKYAGAGHLVKEMKLVHPKKK
jgi:hypothetical protein